LGIVESAELRFVQKYVPTNSTILELGSSIGVVASFLAAYKNPKRMILVEAYPDLIPLLKDNLTLNNATNFKILNAAISSTKKDLYFSTRAGHN
jgi:FkbM family methyltransferase